MKEYLDKLRGSPELIRERLAPYIEYYKGCSNVLDLACGRGEFLGLLKEAGISAVGVDNDPDTIGICSRAGYDVRESDIFEFLEANSGFDGIMASHIIEHLDGHGASELLSHCYRCLTPGGRLIVITPNPENIDVISRTFWLDPNHIRPYPLMLLEEMFTDVGLRVASSGEDAATVDSIRAAGLRAIIARFALPPLGIAYFRRSLRLARDNYIVGEKAEKPG